ncbi:hypothetical protein KC19_VG081400 [Ceratodon purpureus]|uniref:Uncharacterized protein n=1 Tax=Ceratodon purpureus TaxID=3225 RepID=A0A8T0HN70_CERPU|nr:hypothetical protein KC19_VG081400 [Ceratodon purpureus]
MYLSGVGAKRPPQTIADNSAQVAQPPVSARQPEPIPVQPPRGDEVGLPMSWSPRRYGRNPGSKRGAGNTSLPHSPVRSNATSKRLVLSPPEPPIAHPLHTVEQLGELCIIRDEPPASTFRKIEAIQHRGTQVATSSDASSSLHLADFPTQHLTSSPTDLPVACAQQSPCSSSSLPTSSPYAGSIPLSEATSKDGRLNLPQPCDSSNDSGARASSVRLAATYKAKWSAMTKRLEDATSKPTQSASTSTPPTRAQ